MSSQVQKTDNWTKFTIVQLVGLSLGGKIFAVIAGPLIVFTIFNRDLCHRLYTALTKRDPLTYLCWALLLSIIDGIWEAVYGFLSGYKPLTILEVLVFSFCPIYIFLGIWAGERRPGLVRTVIAWGAWFGTVSTLIYYFFLRNSEGAAGPASGLSVLIGLFCFGFSPSRFWFPTLVLSFNLIAAQVRADWAALIIALAVWAAATRRIGRASSIAGVLLGLLIIGFAFDLRMPGLPGRGGEISARDTVGRALSSFNPELAKEYSSGVATYAGTVQWRETWWKAIREAVNEHYSTRIFGMGYGYPIGDLVSYLKGADIRTPHSIFYFTLCYSGWVGVILFYTLQASILALLWQTYKSTGQIYGFVVHISLLTSSLFGNLFEAPQASIPNYILLGMCIGPLFAQAHPPLGNANFRDAVLQESLTLSPVKRRTRPRSFAQARGEREAVRP